jgi:hypothetical protein
VRSLPLSETHCWAHYPGRENKLSKFGVYRPWSRDVRIAKAPHLSLGCRPIGAGRIFSQLSAEKQWVGGGGVYYTRPYLP